MLGFNCKLLFRRNIYLLVNPAFGQGWVQSLLTFLFRAYRFSNTMA